MNNFEGMKRFVEIQRRPYHGWNACIGCYGIDPDHVPGSADDPSQAVRQSLSCTRGAPGFQR